MPEILVNHRKLSNLQNLLNTELDALSEWCADNQLTINPTKSQVLIILPNLKANFENFSVNINNVSVSANEYAKYLGVLIDSKLNYNFQIKAVELKLSRAVGIITKLKYFLPRNVLLQLYYALVHPHLLYGLSVWGSTYPSYFAKLSTLQNKAVKIVGGKIFDRVTPFYTKLNIPKLQDLYTVEIAKLTYNFIHQPNFLPNMLSDILYQSHQRIPETTQIFNSPYRPFIHST